MSSTPLSGGESVPSARPSDPDRDAIVDQLDRILASTLFRHSKRCGPLLRYIVMETIDGRSEGLKERSLGVAAFGRKPTYDTNDDPIVRSSAAEVRKRIAQYYHEAGHESELRIELTSGSYVPHFHAPAAPYRGAPVDVRSAAPATAKTGERLSLVKILLGAAAVVAVAGVVWAWRANLDSRNPSKAFWTPLVSAGTVILASGDVTDAPGMGIESAAGAMTFAQTSQGDRLGFADGVAMARVAALLGAQGIHLDTRRAGSLTLTDLRQAPAVLIGEMSNPWTRLLEGEMRFRFNWDLTNQVVRLEDRQTPKQPLWELGLNTAYSKLKEDRAIITRVVDRRTEHAVLILAGCGRDGTIAAAEFVCEPRYLETLAGQAPRGWNRRNLQVVIATDLINGHTGPPRIVATHFW